MPSFFSSESEFLHNLNSSQLYFPGRIKPNNKERQRVIDEKSTQLKQILLG